MGYIQTEQEVVSVDNSSYIWLSLSSLHVFLSLPAMLQQQLLVD